jgi:hypothetical protein
MAYFKWPPFSEDRVKIIFYKFICVPANTFCNNNNNNIYYPSSKRSCPSDHMAAGEIQFLSSMLNILKQTKIK